MAAEPVQTTGKIAQNPYFFIVGCKRSGTTLLRRVVNAHPQIAVSREMHWIPKWFEQRRGLTPEGLVTGKLVSRLLAYRKFSRLGVGGEELERLIGSDEPISYSSFVTGIFDLYGEGQGKRLVGAKEPGSVRNLRTLHDLWPAARFVHLIRDGRDVCLSIRRKSGEKGSRYSTWASSRKNVGRHSKYL